MSQKTDQSDGRELERELAALREDFANVAKLLKSEAEGRVEGAASHARSSANELVREASERGHAARLAVNDTVRGNPVATLAAAAMLGFMLGALTRR